MATSQLMMTDFDHTKIQQKISDENSLSRLHLLGYALQKIVVNTVIYSLLLLTAEELKDLILRKGIRRDL